MIKDFPNKGNIPYVQETIDTLTSMGVDDEIINIIIKQMTTPLIEVLKEKFSAQTSQCNIYMFPRFSDENNKCKDIIECWNPLIKHLLNKTSFIELSCMENEGELALLSETHMSVISKSAQMKSLLDRTFCLNDYNKGWKSRLSPHKKAIILGVCSGSSKESMGYTIEGISKTFSELGVKILDTIEYYNTKQTSVANNSTIRQEIINRVKELIEFL